jgi:hypothetical protein
MPVFARQDADGRVLRAIVDMAPGSEIDGKPLLRYIALLCDGACQRSARA